MYVTVGLSCHNCIRFHLEQNHGVRKMVKVALCNEHPKVEPILLRPVDQNLLSHTEHISTTICDELFPLRLFN